MRKILLLSFLVLFCFKIESYASELESLTKSLQLKLNHIEKNIDNETILNHYKSECMKIIHTNYIPITTSFCNKEFSIVKQNIKIEFLKALINLIVIDLLNVETKADFKNKIKEKLRELMTLKISFSNDHEFYKLIITFYIATFAIKKNESDINLNEVILDFLNETFKMNTIQTLKITEKYLNTVFEKIDFLKIGKELNEKIKRLELEGSKNKKTKIKKDRITDHYDLRQLLKNSKESSEEKEVAEINLDEELNYAINDIKNLESYKLNDGEIHNLFKFNSHSEVLSKIKSFEDKIINDNAIFDNKIELFIYIIKILETNEENGYIQIMEKIHNNSKNGTEEEALINQKRKELINLEIKKILSTELRTILVMLSYYSSIYSDKNYLIVKHLENEILKKYTEVKCRLEKKKGIKSLNDIIKILSEEKIS